MCLVVERLRECGGEVCVCVGGAWIIAPPPFHSPPPLLLPSSTVASQSNSHLLRLAHYEGNTTSTGSSPTCPPGQRGLLSPQLIYPPQFPQVLPTQTHATQTRTQPDSHLQNQQMIHSTLGRRRLCVRARARLSESHAFQAQKGAGFIVSPFFQSREAEEGEGRIMKSAASCSRPGHPK